MYCRVLQRRQTLSIECSVRRRSMALVGFNFINSSNIFYSYQFLLFEVIYDILILNGGSLNYQLIMSQEQQKLNHQTEKISPDIDNYEQLMEEGKQVLDNIHLSHSYREDIFELQRQRENISIIIAGNTRPIRTNQDNHDSEEALDLQPSSGEKLEGNDNMQAMIKKPSKVVVTCNCLKSKCTKNYCECFTQARKCNELCKCLGCENQGEVEKRYRPTFDLEEGERVCNCKKSNCLKKYCECYNSGVKCNANCKCQECKNCSEQGQNQDCEEAKEQIRRERSEHQVQQINAKIEQISRIVPKQYQESVFSFLEYWLA